MKSENVYPPLMNSVISRVGSYSFTTTKPVDLLFGQLVFGLGNGFIDHPHPSLPPSRGKELVVLPSIQMGEG